MANVQAVTIAETSSGKLVWLDREAGSVFEQGQSEPLVTVPVDAESQGGILGLAVDEQDRIFVSWVAPDRQLQVARIDGAELVAVWEGVQAPNGGLGGRLAFDSDGQLVVGLGNGADLAELDVRGGAMVRINPDGPAAQTPEVISEAWNNPFAFGFAPDGELWVADNHPSDGDERLARADLGEGAERITVLPSKFAASGLIAVDTDELWICSYTTLRIDRYRIGDSGLAERSGTVATDCLLDLTLLANGNVAYSTGDAIKVIER